MLHVDHVHLDTRWNYKHVISPYYRLYYIDDGEGTISDPGARIKLSPGNLYLIPSFTLCNLHCNNYLSQYFVQFFEEAPDGLSLFYNKRMLMKKAATAGDIANIKRLLQINPNRGINRSDNPRVYEKHAFYREYQELNNLQSDAVYLETQGILLQLLSRFMDQQEQSPDGGQVIPSKIMDTISYIQMHLREPLTVAFLASRVNHNQDYFSRQFLQFTGLRPLHYMHEKRIERAQYLIATTDAGYTEIAAEVGFDNLPHFSKVFRKVTGMTPNKYRLQNRMV
ncbi:AraC family transcriptional regulator [Chitinophaga jiangningensis]|uniref:AraC family transcriptional regulator n=1 Tax=Chitinophaga jiangningensis TaxID=1419482 RepID=UPI001FEB22FD|nr:AraC family transcriptional regulator [Chitinophaga jiangningensis]